MTVHRGARLTPHGRAEIVRRVVGAALLPSANHRQTALATALCGLRLCNCLCKAARYVPFCSNQPIRFSRRFYFSADWFCELLIDA